MKLHSFHLELRSQSLCLTNSSFESRIVFRAVIHHLSQGEIATATTIITSAATINLPKLAKFLKVVSKCPSEKAENFFQIFLIPITIVLFAPAATATTVMTKFN